jgi:hypothetical protein
MKQQCSSKNSTPKRTLKDSPYLEALQLAKDAVHENCHTNFVLNSQLSFEPASGRLIE